MDLNALFSGGGSWAVVGVLAMFTIGPYALFSKDNADKWWALGRVSRWVRDRKVREIEENSRLADVTLKAHSDDRARWAQQMQEMRDEYAADRERWKATESKLRSDLLEAFDYIDYLITWVRSARTRHSENGWEPDLDAWMSFSEWKLRK